MSNSETDNRPISRRTFLAGAAAVAGSAAVAACGGSNLGQNGGGSGGNKIVLTQYYHQYGEKGTQQAVERYAADYMKQNPNVQINVQWVPGDYGTKLSTALVGPNPPDLFETSPTVQMVKQGQAVPLDDLFSDADKADYFSNVLASNTINGKIYGLKMVTDLGLLYMRKSIFQKANAQPPKTIDDVITLAQKLTQGQQKGLFLGNDGGIGALLVLLPQSNKVQFMNGAANQVQFATPEAAQAIQALVKLNQSNTLLLNYASDYLQPDAFNAGVTAMQWTGLWAMREVQDAIKDDFEVMAWPAFSSSGTPITFLGGWSQVVNGHGKHVDEAKKYAKWLWITNKDVQQDFNLSYGLHIPPRKSIAENAKFLKSGPGKTAVDALDKYGLALPPSWDATMNTYYTDAVSSAVKNNADLSSIQNLLTQAQQKCQQELDQELK